MAWKIDAHDALPKIAASAIAQHVPVFSSASSADQVVPLTVASPGEPLGMTIATAASPGVPVAVQKSGVGKAIAAASLGPGANVGVANSSGALGPQGASASQFRLGISQNAALTGETFSVLILPGKVGA